MSSPPVGLDDELNILRDKGRILAIRNNYLIMMVPYLDREGNLRRGFIADALNLPDGTNLEKPANHQMWFVGDEPFGLMGNSLVLPAGPLGGGENRTLLFSDNYSSFYFSHKISSASGPRDYQSFSEKFGQYFNFISGPARHKFPEADEIFNEVDFGEELDSPFMFPDTHSSHNELLELNQPFRSLRVAIVGLGGTGSYVLDLLVKTPIKDIVIIDDDEFSLKSAYRAPTCGKISEFKKPKVDVFAERYRAFRKGIVPFNSKLSSETSNLLDEVSFAFICVDDGVARRDIVEVLNQRQIPFIDCGMGLSKIGTSLNGMVRTTVVTNDSRARISQEQRIPVVAEPENVYQNNVQIAELNSLNASLAVIYFKKLFGFYSNDNPVYNHIFVLGKDADLRQRVNPA